MPLPKEPSKLATTLTDIPPIPATKANKRDTKKSALVQPPANTAVVTAKASTPALKLASSNTVVARDEKPASTGKSSSTAHSTQSKTRKGTEVNRSKRQVSGAGKKIYVLDTNVLMHDPTSMFRFEEHDVFLPLITLEELDNHKKGMSEVARHARQVSRSLDALMENVDSIEQGVPLSKLGNTDALGRLLVQTTELTAELPKTLPVGKADNQILGVVFALARQHPDKEVALVSKDINMRIKARALGLLAEDYFNDQVLEDRDLLYSGHLELPADFWEKNSKGIESWQQAGSTYYRISGPAVKDMMVNQFVYCDTGMPLIAQVIELAGRTAVLKTLRDFSHNKNSVWGITARNREQNFALNLLMNPECDFVTLLGQAGTGKTLLALAAGLSQVLESKQYSEIIVTRATVPVGEDIGFLPGTEEEKMAPWMGAFEDNLEVLNKPDPSAGDWGRSATADLIRTKIRIKSMNFMRGRTFINKFLIIDEAQNLSPKQMKTLITRAGPGTKVVCLGNLAQIDTPYLTEGSSGLTYVVDRFKGWPHAGHITLQRGERSRLADFASDNL
ncbi:MAG TPA: PhoH family protein [Limnobacter sp.]|uniref:PhoH family protein n=1 Tax=Limnobacter sp. TaxID=2003368 RepID=UPI002ED834F5